MDSWDEKHEVEKRLDVVPKLGSSADIPATGLAALG